MNRETLAVLNNELFYKLLMTNDYDGYRIINSTVIPTYRNITSIKVNYCFVPRQSFLMNRLVDTTAWSTGYNNNKIKEWRY